MSAGNNSNRILVVEYLRGLAALGVAWFHLTNTYQPGLLRHSGSYGWLGVDVFFVISGFIVPYSISLVYPAYGLKDYPNFCVRRILRLEPPYLASIFLVVVLAYASALAPDFRGQPIELSPGQIASHLFYVVPFTSYSWLQPVYWTLAWEFAFYLIFGLMFPLAGHRKARGGTILGMSGALILAVWFSLVNERVLLFVLGITAYRLLTAGRTEVWSLALVLAGSTAAIARAYPEIAFAGVITALVISCFPRVAMSGAAGRILQFLGLISYSLYLVHVPVGGRVVNLGARFIDGELQQLFLTLFALMMSIAAAWVFMRLVERPAIAWARRFRPDCQPRKVSA
jgi:peptidoglycan/LPS O-acetylase OafA/YrhL